MTFLTVVTRTFRRPRALQLCTASLLTQDLRDFQHIIIPDDEGVGIPETYRRLRDRDWSDVYGEYVYFLDDDNLITDRQALRGLLEVCKKYRYPEMVVFRADLCGQVVPEDPWWRMRPQVAHIDLGCAALRRDLFLFAARRFGRRYEGDYDYLISAFLRSSSTSWWDFVFMRAQRISKGEPEHEEITS